MYGQLDYGASGTTHASACSALPVTARVSILRLGVPVEDKKPASSQLLVAAVICSYDRLLWALSNKRPADYACD
jgi:hypothetical protein